MGALLAPEAPPTDHDFDHLMAPFAPFETAPHLAVACSGGGDSMALCLLAHRWAAIRGGQVTAVTVDHGLRPESAEEARQVGRALAERGIAHATVRWREPRPRTRLQEAARDARYGLLERWCTEAGILHLLVAHTRDDAAETVFMRAVRATGAEGLAGMSAVVELTQVRILRPLLSVTRDSLRALLTADGVDWFEDPSNADAAFERVRVRRLLGDGDAGCRLAAIGDAAGVARRTLETAQASAAAAACQVHPAGFAWLDTDMLSRLPKPVAAGVLSRLVSMLGGAGRPPRREKVARLLSDLSADDAPRAATLGGCRIVPRGGRTLVCRERRGRGPCLSIVRDGRMRWDRRFDVDVTAGRDKPAWVSPLGRAGWADVVSDQPLVAGTPIPAPARLMLPALWDEAGVSQVPHLAYNRRGEDPGSARIRTIRLAPSVMLSAAGFCLASRARHTI